MASNVAVPCFDPNCPGQARLIDCHWLCDTCGKTFFAGLSDLVDLHVDLVNEEAS